MKFGQAWIFLLGLGWIILTLSARPAQIAHAAAPPHPTTVLVPFIGCASFGQTEFLKAPTGTNKSALIDPKDVPMLAYYRSSDGIGVLAPRGWYCEGVSGSSGAALFVSPKPIARTMTGEEGFRGPAIELYQMTREGSGRSAIAEIILRAFSVYKAFATRVMKDMDSPLPTGPYPNDTLTYRRKTVVEYSTPAQADGLGTT